MVDMQDIKVKPSIQDISAYIDNPLFLQFFSYMNDTYQALYKIEYSKDVWAHGWNLKLRKAGKSLCVIYPRKSYFTILIVVGKKEKEKVEELLPSLTKKMQDFYHSTKEGNGQRWLMIDLEEEDDFYQDVLKLIKIRRESK